MNGETADTKPEVLVALGEMYGAVYYFHPDVAPSPEVASAFRP